MLMDHTKFVVKSKGKAFSSKKSFEILDGESGQLLGTGKDTTGFLAGLFGTTRIEVRDSSSNSLVFVVARSGWLMKKDQVLDSQGEVVGRYKAKMFSLSGGFHMYDKGGTHLGVIQGKMFKAEYKFVTPDKQTEMGTVSRSWGGLAKSLLTDADTYGVVIAPRCAEDARAKMLILGATIAVESIFKKKAGKAGESSSSGGGDE